MHRHTGWDVSSGTALPEEMSWVRMVRLVANIAAPQRGQAGGSVGAGVSGTGLTISNPAPARRPAEVGDG